MCGSLILLGGGASDTSKHWLGDALAVSHCWVCTVLLLDVDADAVGGSRFHRGVNVNKVPRYDMMVGMRATGIGLWQALLKGGEVNALR